MNNGMSSQDMVNFSSPALQPGLMQNVQYQNGVPPVRMLPRQPHMGGNRVFYPSPVPNVMNSAAQLLSGQQYAYQGQRGSAQAQFTGVMPPVQMGKRAKAATKFGQLPPAAGAPPPKPKGPSARRPTDQQALYAKLSQLPRDKLELALALFDCGGAPDRREEQLISALTSVATSRIPNCFELMSHALDVLASQSLSLEALVSRLSVPVIFARSRECRPVFKNVPIVHEFELLHGAKEKKLLPLASFFSLTDAEGPALPCRVFADGVEVVPRQYGGSGYFFPLYEVEKSRGKRQRSVYRFADVKKVSFYTFLAIQFVEKREVEDVLRDVLGKYGLSVSTHPDPFVRTRSCSQCSIRLVDVIENVMLNGCAMCPTCNAPISFNELVFVEGVQNGQNAEIFQEDEESMIARLCFSEQVCNHIKFNDIKYSDSWNDFFFGESVT